VIDPAHERDTIEKEFFAESNFRSLPAPNLGIEHLRHRLSMVLFGQIRAELPQLIEDIETGISSCRRELEKLEPARITLDDQKDFYVDLSDEFQKLCKAAVKGDYDDDFFADSSLPSRRLSAMIANMGMGFANNVGIEGAQWKIVRGGSSKRHYRTHAQAIEEVRKLLRKSRGREVGTPFPMSCGIFVNVLMRSLVAGPPKSVVGW
jgi:hypothetical protein